MHLSALRWSFLGSVLGFVLALVPACSDSDPILIPDASTETPDGALPESDAGAEGGDGNVEETCAEYARLECARDRDCFSVYLDWTYGSYEACLPESRQTCLVWSSLAGSSLTAQQLVTCLRAYVTAGCDAAGPFAECQAAPGTLSSGSGCLLNDQCFSGYCRREGTNGCGECAGKLSEGAACSRAADCQSGRCSDGRCAPILKEGEGCPVSTDCLRDLICQDGVCQKVTLVGDGQACGGTNVCDVYMTCANGRCVKDVAVDIGQTCGTTGNGGLALCRAGDCDTQSTCVNRPPAGTACSEAGSCGGASVCYQGQCRALTSDVCDVPPQRAHPEERVEEVDRAPLTGRSPRARPRQGRMTGR